MPVLREMVKSVIFTKMNIIREKHKKPPAFRTEFGTKIRKINGFKGKNFALSVTKYVKQNNRIKRVISFYTAIFLVKINLTKFRYILRLNLLSATPYGCAIYI